MEGIREEFMEEKWVVDLIKTDAFVQFSNNKNIYYYYYHYYFTKGDCPGLSRSAIYNHESLKEKKQEAEEPLLSGTTGVGFWGAAVHLMLL